MTVSNTIKIFDTSNGTAFEAVGDGYIKIMRADQPECIVPATDLFDATSFIKESIREIKKSIKELPVHPKSVVD